MNGSGYEKDLINNIMKKLLLIPLLLILGCSPESDIKPTMDRTNQDIRIRVIFHETQVSLEEAYRIANNLPSRTPVPEQWGFAAWNQWRDPRTGNFIDIIPPGQEYWCNIHAFRPKNQADQRVLTLGHELLHCVYGSFHD
jgi:hypothetical protein